MIHLNELNYEELKNCWQESGVVVTVVYTPTCGTCILAKKMIGIVQETCSNVKFGQINLNLNERLAIDYEISSVPCLLIHQNNQCVDKIHTFQSVPYLYEKINSYISLPELMQY